MVDPEPGVALEAVAPIFPERVDALTRVQVPDGVGPALGNEMSIGLADFRPEKGIVQPALGLVDVDPRRHDVEVAGEDRGHAEIEEFGGIEVEAAEPAELVVEFRARERVAVGKIQAADHDAVDDGFDIAAVGVVGIAGKPAPCQDRCLTSRKDGDAVP